MCTYVKYIHFHFPHRRERDANLEREIDIGCCVHCAFCIENSNFEFKRPGSGQRQENNLYFKHRNETFSKSFFFKKKEETHQTIILQLYW